MDKADEVDIDSPVNSVDINIEPNSIAETSVENRADKNMNDYSDQDYSACITSSGRLSKPYDYSKYFLETTHSQERTIEGRRLKPHYYNWVEMIEQLGDGMFYNESCFSEDVVEK